MLWNNLIDVFEVLKLFFYYKHSYKILYKKFSSLKKLQIFDYINIL